MIGLVLSLSLSFMLVNANFVEAAMKYFSPFEEFKLGSYDITDQVVDILGDTKSYGDGTGIILLPARAIKKYIPKGSRIHFTLKKGYKIKNLEMQYYKNGRVKKQTLKNNSKLKAGWESVSQIQFRIKRGKWIIFAGIYSEGGPTKMN